MIWPRHLQWLALPGLSLTGLSLPALAQRPDAAPAAIQPGARAAGAISLSLAEAIELALTQDYALRQSRLDMKTAEAQIDEVWGQVYPSVNLQAGYTRTLKAANPFAGSNAGGIFSGLGAVEWLAYNESARTDGNPNTDPISLNEFLTRQSEGRAAAGIQLNESDNPFLVPNQFNATLTVTQLLYSGGTFDAIEGARIYKAQSGEAARQRAHQIVSEVAQAYYGVLLAEAAESVLARSVERAKIAVQEARQRVERGVAPRFQQLTAEVELTNLETQRLQAEHQISQAEDSLRLALALPARSPLKLTERLGPEAPAEEDIAAVLKADLSGDARPDPVAAEILAEDDALPDLDGALEAALRDRPDVAAQRLSLKYQRILQETARSDFGPRIEAFLQGGYVGQVPDDRNVITSDPEDPFSFSQSEESFFSDSYWFPSVSAGITLTWNLFDGFATTARVEQQSLAAGRAQVQHDQLVASVRTEVIAAHRALSEARARLEAQGRNVEQAVLNYAHAKVRVREGVSSQVELRAASDQLDQARLNRLQAIHDHRVARLSFLVATGKPPHLNANDRGTTP